MYLMNQLYNELNLVYMHLFDYFLVLIFFVDHQHIDESLKQDNSLLIYVYENVLLFSRLCAASIRFLTSIPECRLNERQHKRGRIYNKAWINKINGTN